MRTLIVLVLLARTAAAEEPPEANSFWTAYAVTVGSTTLPIAAAVLVAGDETEGTRANTAGIVATAALLVGPSAGHFYLGETWTMGLTLRLGGAAVIGAMVLREQQAPLETGTLIVGGMSAAGLIGVGMLWDLVTLPSATRRANERLVLAPTTNGFAVAGRF
jgi:hypothetical protein